MGYITTGPVVQDRVFSEVAAEIQFKSCLHSVSGVGVLTASPLPENLSGKGQINGWLFRK
jgi:hypothetical protein